MPFSDPAKQHANNTGRIRRRRDAWFKEHGPCPCGSTERLEVDHVDPTKKVSHRIWNWSDAKRLPELAKCQPLCHDCHLKKTKAQRYTPPDHGTHSRYNHHGCRCAPCRAAHAATNALYRKRAVASTQRPGALAG